MRFSDVSGGELPEPDKEKKPIPDDGIKPNDSKKTSRPFKFQEKGKRSDRFYDDSPIQINVDKH